jgi:hypothetical protein
MPVALMGIRRATLLVATLVLGGVLAPKFAAGIEIKPFGIESFSMQTTETSPAGVSEPYVFTQASGHPYALTTSVQFSSEEAAGRTVVGGDPRDIVIHLPPGVVANPQVAGHCAGQVEHCPTDSQIGVFSLRFTTGQQEVSAFGAIVNMTPPAGQAAELGLEVPLLGRVLLTGHVVYTPRGYSLAIVGRGFPIPSLGGEFPSLHLLSMETTLWGIPAAPAHDFQRGKSCYGFGGGAQSNCTGGGLSSGEEPEPFLTMPGGCSGGLTTVAWADSWEHPGVYLQSQSILPAMAYCDRLPFHPEIAVRPESSITDGVVGVSVNVKVPQIEGSTAIVATPPLRSATITLPQGLSINPSVGEGLQACAASGPGGIDIPTGLNASGEALRPGEAGPGEEVPPEGLGPEEPVLAPGHCPEASTVGTAEAITPFLPYPIEGRVYLAAPGCGGPDQSPCSEQDAVDGNLYRLYVELGGRGSQRSEGVLIKLAATVQANAATGQLTVRLSEAPQLPISQLSLRMFGGERSLLANPSKCGPATTTVDLEPWSAPYAPNAASYSYYEVTGCAGHALPPKLVAGSVNTLAGSFSPFVFTVTRSEREPYLSQLQLHGPAGLSAMLSSVPVCDTALATAGGCPDSSRIGSSTVAAGAGSPLRMAGTVYLTGPYQGAPFGLSIVTHAVAGPLDLGTVVIRARIDIDPRTGGLIITSDRLPQIVLGVPLRVRQIMLNIDRPGFIVNPTNCNAEQITATIAGVEGAIASPTNPFAVGGCRGLAFKPTLKASTTGHTGYASGASLDLKLALPKGGVGEGANLRRMKVALPPQLPSRLTTLQGACRGGTFDANPAACPATSIVGIARVRTPVLSTQLTGPVYLVSRGPNAFPSPVVVLQGEGITLDLSGSTTVHGSGSSVTFNAIPDIPVQSMEIYLPQGPHSLLSANTKLCALGKLVTVTHTVTRRVGGRTVTRKVRVRERVASLPMPTSLVAQNGLVVHKAAKIDVRGCGVGGARSVRAR